MRDSLVNFIYLLLFELPAPKIENLISTCVLDDVVNKNSLMFQYANTLAELLKDTKSDNLLEDLIGQKDLKDEDLAALEQQIIQEYGEETNAEAKKQNTIEAAQKAVEQLKVSGGLSKEDIERIEHELEEVKIDVANTQQTTK